MDQTTSVGDAVPTVEQVMLGLLCDARRALSRSSHFCSHNHLHDVYDVEDLGTKVYICLCQREFFAFCTPCRCYQISPPRYSLVLYAYRSNRTCLPLYVAPGWRPKYSYSFQKNFGPLGKRFIEESFLREKSYWYSTL